MNSPGPGEAEFDPPPGHSGTEDSGYETPSKFVAPGEHSVPDPVVDQYSHARSGPPDSLLTAKASVEQHLAQQVSSTPRTLTSDALAGAGLIQGVAFGVSEVEDHTATAEPGTSSLVLYVAEPVSVGEARSLLVDSLGVSAAEVGDFPIRVVVTGIVDAQPHRFHARPVPGGTSAGHLHVTAGTLGCLAIGLRPPRSSRLMALSNNHVFAAVNSGSAGDCIMQPGAADGGDCPADQIGVLEQFVPIDFNGGVNYVDCATAWCWPDRVRPELVRLVRGQQQFFRIGQAPVAPALGMAVGKSGRTTQLTSGSITAVGVSINVNFGAGRVGLFQDQIAVQATSGDFSAGGDSGSVIWANNSDRRPVGLLFAGGGGTTFANRMDRVVVALDIAPYT